MYVLRHPLDPGLGQLDTGLTDVCLQRASDGAQVDLDREIARLERRNRDNRIRQHQMQMRNPYLRRFKIGEYIPDPDDDAA